VGSFYAFAIWIGLAVPYLSRWHQHGPADLKIDTGLRRRNGSVIFVWRADCRRRFALGLGFAVYCRGCGRCALYIKNDKSREAIVYASFLVALAVPVLMGTRNGMIMTAAKKQ